MHPLPETEKDHSQHKIRSLFLFLLLECFTSITWQWAKTVQTLYRTKHRLPQSEPPSFSQASHVLYTTGVTHTPLLTPSSTRHTVHNRPHEHLRHTHIHYLYLNTARKCAELKTAVMSDNLMLDRRLSATISTETEPWRNSYSVSSQTNGFLYMTCDCFSAFSVTIFSTAVFSS